MTALLSTMAQVKIGPGFLIVFEAIDPATNDPVDGVVIQTGTLYADQVDAPADDETLTEDVALLTPVELDNQATVLE